MAWTVNIGGKDNTLGRVFIGEDKIIDFEMLNGDPDDTASIPVNITGFAFLFVCRQSIDAVAALISKSLSVTGTYSATRSVNTQRARLSLTDTDLSSSVFPKAMSAYYSVKRTDDGSETISHEGKFIVEQATQV